MPDRAMELRHLAQADRHIIDGDRRVLEIARAIDRSIAHRMNVTCARVTLARVVDLLATFKAHRLLILQAIERIDQRDTVRGDSQQQRRNIPPGPGPGASASGSVR